VYLVAMVIAGISFVMSWFIKTQPLRDKSAMEENLEAQAAGAL
jgi:hypothetical protein